MAGPSLTAGTAAAEEWQSGRGSLARQVSQGQGDSHFLSLLLFSSSTCLSDFPPVLKGIGVGVCDLWSSAEPSQNNKKRPRSLIIT